MRKLLWLFLFIGNTSISLGHTVLQNFHREYDGCLCVTVWNEITVVKCSNDTTSQSVLITQFNFGKLGQPTYPHSHSPHWHTFSTDASDLMRSIVACVTRSTCCNQAVQEDKWNKNDGVYTTTHFHTIWIFMNICKLSGQIRELSATSLVQVQMPHPPS